MGLALDLPTAEDMNTGGTYLTTPGKYHCLIVHAEENPTRNDKLVKGFLLELAVQNAGDQQGMTFKAYFANGDPAHKDGGAFALKKQVAALIASNVVGPADLGKAGVEIDVEKAKDSQVLVELALGQPDKTTGKQYLDIAYANIFHIDDPRAKTFPKDADTISLVPKEYRRSEDFFAPLMVKPKAAPKPKDTDFDGL